MKKNIFLLFFIFIGINTFGIDYNINLETDFLYTTYIKNKIFSIMEQTTTITSFSTNERIDIKIKQETENTKLYFDTRLYLYPLKSDFSYVIDNAYFSIYNNDLIIYAGKQRIKWGVGFFFNPSDLLQPSKDLLEPDRYLEGIYALRIEYSNDFLTPSFIIAFNPVPYKYNWYENFKFAIQLYKLIGNMDLFFNGIYEEKKLQSIGLNLSFDLKLFVLNFESAAIRYMDENLNILRFLNKEKSTTIKYNYLIGISKTLNDLFFTIEYYKNNWGITNGDFTYLVNNITTFNISESLYSNLLKTDYIASSLSYTYNDTYNFYISIIYGLNDSTLFLFPKISYVENSNFDITIGYFENLTKTDEIKEGNILIPAYNTVELRLNAYF